MNVQLQICGLVIVIFLLILFKTHKTIKVSEESVFTQLLIFTIACITLDALSVFAIRYREAFTDTGMMICCNAYLISMIWVGMFYFSYVTLDFSKSSAGHKRLIKILSIVTAVESIVIIILPLDVYDDGKSIYSLGPAVIATYIFTIIYILSILSVAIFIYKKSNSRRGMAVILTTSLWIIAAAVQFINNALLVVGFSMAIGAMILYIVMENPDSNLDRSLGCFNPYALQRFLTMKIEKQNPFCVMDISIIDAKLLEERGMDISNEAKKISSMVMRSKNIHLFKNLSAGFIAVADTETALNGITDYIHESYIHYDNIDQILMASTVNNAQQFESADELLKFLNYVRNNSTERVSSYVHVSEDAINEYKNIQKTEDAINLALKEDRVEAFLQPIVSLARQKVVSAEALVRIRNKDGSIMSPGQFIPVAEATGQVRELGERVLEKVCVFLKTSEAIELGLENVHVNLSVVQCSSTNSVAPLLNIVEEHEVDPKYIHFEITETAVTTAKDTLIENMNNLISKGFKFALDDFGKGESNLMYMVDMPVSILKLDMDMSKAYFKSAKARVVVESVTNMARMIGLPVVAEGIETKEELDDIQSGGVTHIQGYYFSRPLPMDEFIEYLKSAQIQISGSDEIVQISSESTSGNLISMKGNKILLVDDNELNLDIAQEILEESGFVVDTACDGTDAVDMVARCKDDIYDLILMDIRMPIMDGYEATRRIRHLPDERLSSIPIVALTAASGDEVNKISKDATMNAYLEKPFSVEKFRELIN